MSRRDNSDWTFTCELCGKEVQHIRLVCKGGNSITFCVHCHEYAVKHFSELEYVGGSYEIN